MAATFLQAFVSAYGTVAAAQTTLPANVWTEQVPDDQTEYPRAELIVADGSTVLDKDGPQMQSVSAHLTIYDTTLLGVDTLCGVLMNSTTGLNTTALTIDGTKNRLWRTNYVPAGIAKERSTDQKPIYTGTISYLCEIARG